MKIQLENIAPEPSSSFRWLINPKLNDFYFWHFHPEYEITFIEAAEGTRQVGEHIGKFYRHDLVLIGSNIPHLNFDYGIKTEYEKTVLHIQSDFLKDNDLPELKTIEKLFERSNKGIVFGETVKQAVGEILKKIHELPHFEQLVEVLKVLKFLSETPDFDLLHEQEPQKPINKKSHERLQKLYRFIDENYQRKINISEITDLCNMSKAAFCRYFKQMTKLTFSEFLNHYRIYEAKRLLLLDKNISETCFLCGFESLSYFNRIFKEVTGQNPSAFKKAYLNS